MWSDIAGTTCNIRPHFLGPMGGLKIEGLLYIPDDIISQGPSEVVFHYEILQFQQDSNLYALVPFFVATLYRGHLL